MKKLPIYDVILSDDDLGMTAVSFVDEPAIEELFVAFNKQHIMMANEKQEVISPILIPDQEIYRYDKNTGKEFYIRWSQETIDAVAVQYLLNQRQNNTTIMHPQFYDASLQLEDCLVDDVYLKRMWIIDNPKTDIANTKFGYSLPQGTLMVHYKIFNNHLWQRIKKAGQPHQIFKIFLRYPISKAALYSLFLRLNLSFCSDTMCNAIFLKTDRF